MSDVEIEEKRHSHSEHYIVEVWDVIDGTLANKITYGYVEDANNRYNRELKTIGDGYKLTLKKVEGVEITRYETTTIRED